MHFEILIEDVSGKKLLDLLMPKIFDSGSGHSWRIISYKGLGHIPKNLRGEHNPSKRLLLNQLPRLLAGYGNTYPNGRNGVVVVIIVDCDSTRCVDLLSQLNGVLNACISKPKVLFRLAIEECEAWLFGDRAAITQAYPRAKRAILETYVQDSICGTWERLADAIYPGGAKALGAKPYSAIGSMKCEWAERIGRHFNVETNASQSFERFRDGLRRMADQGDGA